MQTLTESSTLRYFTLGALYVAQGLPEGLLLFALPAWLAANGVSAAQTGAILGVAMLPWAFKLVYGPLLDRFTYLPMGRRRPWILAAQGMFGISLLTMGLIPDPTTNLVWLTAVAFIVCLFGSLQDVAVDGMAIEVLPEDQQARANGLMWGSKTVGIATSTAVCGWLLDRYGLMETTSALAVILLLVMTIPLFLRERPGERMLPWTEGQASPAAASLKLHGWRDILVSLVRVFVLPASLVMGCAVFFGRISYGLFTAALPVFTVQELGWSSPQYAQFSATTNLVSGLFGMLVGGALVDFIGKIRMMKITLGLLVLLNGAMALLPFLWTSRTVISAYLVVYQSLTVMLTVAVFATAMTLCWKRISATQFSLYMAIANLGMSAGSSLLGPSSAFGYSAVFIVIGVSSAAMMALLPFVHLDRFAARVERLEVDEPAGVPSLRYLFRSFSTEESRFIPRKARSK